MTAFREDEPVCNLTLWNLLLRWLPTKFKDVVIAISNGISKVMIVPHGIKNKIVPNVLKGCTRFICKGEK